MIQITQLQLITQLVSFSSFWIDRENCKEPFIDKNLIEHDQVPLFQSPGVGISGIASSRTVRAYD